MTRRRRIHPLVPLVVWLGVALTCTVLALAIVLARSAQQDEQLDAAHLAGMELGQQMCLGFQSEMQRQPAIKPAQRLPGGQL